MQFLKVSILVLLFALPVFLQAQYPTAVGTTWEYFQYLDDQVDYRNIISAFEDEVVADTTIDSMTFHKVVRTGWLTTGPFGGGGAYSQRDTIDGNWFYRVQGDTVWVVDSVVTGQAYESILYDFSLIPGDTVPFLPINLIDLTWPTTYFSARYTCAMGDSFICTTPMVLTSIVANSWQPSGLSYGVPQGFESIIYRNDIGTIYSNAYLIVLGVWGQNYRLARLTSQGQELYVDDDVAMSLDPILPPRSFQVYPNPARDHVRVTTEEVIEQVEILDLTGKVIRKSSPGTGSVRQFEVALKGITRGMYLVRITAGDRTGTQKLLVK